MSYLLQNIKNGWLLSIVIGMNVHASSEQQQSNFIRKIRQEIAANTQDNSKFVQKIKNNRIIGHKETQRPLTPIEKSDLGQSSHVKRLQDIKATRAPHCSSATVAKDNFPSPLGLPLSLANNEILPDLHSAERFTLE